MTTTTQENGYLPFVLGVIAVAFGGLIAIGLAILVTQSPNPLWALILLGLGIERVRAAVTAKKTGSPIWRPALVGLLIGVCFALLGATALYLKDAVALWAMILVVLVSDYIV